MHHAASYRRAVRDPVLAEAVALDAARAPLSASDRALVAFAHDLTHNPRRRHDVRLALLRRAGFDDAALLRATEIVAYFNFVNRLATGLGVELEVGGAGEG